MRTFIYECISAGGLGSSSSVPASLQREGWAMLSAVCEDFQRLAGVDVVTLLDDQLPAPRAAECVRTSGMDESEHFRELAARCDWTMVIAPEFGDFLARRSEFVSEVGGRLLGSLPDRSEERRVGKECRSRWS